MQQKLEAIKSLYKVENMPKIADDYGVGRVTIGDWVTIKAAILIKADEDFHS